MKKAACTAIFAFIVCLVFGLWMRYIWGWPWREYVPMYVLGAFLIFELERIRLALIKQSDSRKKEEETAQIRDEQN